MKIVLFACNGSYSHTNLAVRCLREALEREGFSVVIVEVSLRDRREDVLEALYRERAEVYGFSVYIWNLREMLSLAADLKALLPDCVTVFGGPEVSFDTERFDGMPFLDHIITGEGEDALPALCRAVRDGISVPRILAGAVSPSMRREGIYYRNGEFSAGSLLYYESSRGCPYRCAYCLSSACGALRAKSAEETLADLRAFSRLSPKPKVIKFVDRTFNADRERAKTVWRALASPEFDLRYHFEICASLLDEESFSVLAALPAGKVQLEIGLQSTNPETLRAVCRQIEPEAVLSAVRRLHAMGNLHVHLDLIAGLPYESAERFRQSFDDAYGCADVLQLGFLKLLHGTALRRDAAKYGYVCSAEPPYTVLSNDFITHEELYHLSEISDLLDRYANSGAFSETLACALDGNPSPFAFFEGLLAFLKTHDGRAIRQLSQTDAYRYLYGYASAGRDEAGRQVLEDCLRRDYAAHETRRFSPELLKNF